MKKKPIDLQNNGKYSRKHVIVRSFGDSIIDDVSPEGMLRDAINDIFKIKAKDEDVKMLSRTLVALMSLLSTDGEDDSAYGKDLNEMLSIVVQTINACGRMREALDENGIDLDMNEGDDHGEQPV